MKQFVDLHCFEDPYVMQAHHVKCVESTCLMIILKRMTLSDSFFSLCCDLNVLFAITTRMPATGVFSALRSVSCVTKLPMTDKRCENLYINAKRNEIVTQESRLVRQRHTEAAISNSFNMAFLAKALSIINVGFLEKVLRIESGFS